MAESGPQRNVSLILASYPKGAPVAGKDLVVKEDTFDVSKTELPADGVITKNHYFSLDPYQRGRMNDPGNSPKHYVGAFKLDEPITNTAIGTVIKSSNTKFKVGDIVRVQLCPFESFSVHSDASSKLAKLDNPYNLDPKYFLGQLGMPGLTAYSSLYALGEPKKGDTIFVSAASGAVGAMVGQLAKREGMHVIGSVGSDDKLKYILEELGFDGGFNYKTEKPGDALARLAPKGIDVYYENVGGEQLEAALNAMNEFGRIIACGMVSQYNLTPDQAYGVRNLTNIVRKRIRMQGFIVSDKDFGPKYAKELNENVGKWISEGSIKAQLSVTQGLENAGEAFIGMLKGDNFGKAIVAASEHGK